MTSSIAVRVTPRAARPGVRGWRKGPDGRDELELHVAAVPADGAANDAVIMLLAKALGISRSELSILSGPASRHKRISIPFALDEARRRLASG